MGFSFKKFVKKLTPSGDKDKSTAVPAMFLGGDFATPYLNREIGDWYKGYNEKKKEPAKEAARSQEESYKQQQSYIDWQKAEAKKIEEGTSSKEAQAAAAAEAELMRKRQGMASTNTTMDATTGQTLMTVQPFLKKKSVKSSGYWG